MQSGLDDGARYAVAVYCFVSADTHFARSHAARHSPWEPARAVPARAASHLPYKRYTFYNCRCTA